MHIKRVNEMIRVKGLIPLQRRRAFLVTLKGEHIIGITKWTGEALCLLIRPLSGYNETRR